MRCAHSIRGFTLVETISAIVVLAVALPPMLWAIGAAQDQRVDSVMTSRARWLAMEKLEAIVADRYSAERGFDWIDEANYPHEDEVDGYPNFTRSVTITDVGPDLQPGTELHRRATVTVSYANARGRAQNVSLSVVLASWEAPG